MTDESARLRLPLLQPGQAQKEATHNEALTRLDLLTQGSVVAVAVDAPPASPAIGQCWIVGTQPVGDWAGQVGSLAGWTEAGWRFVAPREGMVVAMEGSLIDLRYHAGAWTKGVVAATRVTVDGLPVLGPRQPAIPAPDGGATVDSASRSAISQILESLREHGLIAA